MSKLSVLDMTQDILSDMNSDEVNSISDSIEGMQVARIIQSAYFEMMGNKNWPHLKQLSTLTSSGDGTIPTHMIMPSDIKELHSVEYNTIRSGETKIRWSTVDYITPDAFLRLTSGFDSDNSTVDEVTDNSGAKLLIKNNKQPEYYTSFDDQWVVFDSYDSAVDSTLQTSKTRCWITLAPSFTLTDTFVPDIPTEAFPALLAEAKSTCFTRLKQMPEGKSEQQSRRQRTWLSRKSFSAGSTISFPDYGRK